MKLRLPNARGTCPVVAVESADTSGWQVLHPRRDEPSMGACELHNRTNGLPDCKHDSFLNSSVSTSPTREVSYERCLRLAVSFELLSFKLCSVLIRKCSTFDFV